ncbi:MAG: hypothetical protein O8C64_04215 [Candidatus Methanoperedens sp.]|nr:hypothetical protein [Candidatus Methanoperedens sp.]MCZ7403726.1 hypothetical protein [Candidatus Methanoperedens sp.]
MLTATVRAPAGAHDCRPISRASGSAIETDSAVDARAKNVSKGLFSLLREAEAEKIKCIEEMMKKKSNILKVESPIDFIEEKHES